ncbi:hypothetical protein V5799_005105 [Amblyomma americanum]|uniref:Uncharacterized protein n=1 Tax=Amblyomma americanum TaxID=6943 RepID=A0AAQ4E073_AMBAM
MSNESYGDVVALSLVLVSAILLAVFAWLLMRKYRKEMQKTDLFMLPKLAGTPVTTPPALEFPVVDRTTHLAAFAVREQVTADREASTSASQTVVKAITPEETGAGMQADEGGISRSGVDDKGKPSAYVKKKPSVHDKKKPPVDSETKPPANNKTKPPVDNESKPSADESTKPPADDETKSAAERKGKHKDSSRVSRRKDSRRSSIASAERSSTVKRKSKRHRSEGASTDAAKSKTGDEPSVTSSSSLHKTEPPAAEATTTRDAASVPTTAPCDVTESPVVGQ